MRSLTKVILILGIIVIAACSCDKEDNIEIIQDFSYNGCKSQLKNNLNVESIHFKYLANDQLLVEHLNTYFNCEPDDIIITAIIEGKNIDIYEDEESHAADCICPYDLEFKINEVEKGDNIISVFLMDTKRLTYNININENTDTTILITTI